MCATKLAGVAWFTPTLVATPVPKPAAWAHSVRLPVQLPSGSTPTTPLSIFTPDASAVPAAEESVTREFADTVVMKFTTGKPVKFTLPRPFAPL